MVLEELTRRLRLILTRPAEEAEITELLNVLDEKIWKISALDDEGQGRHDFEEELQVIYDENVDFTQLQSVDIFLNVLVHARPILPATTVIANWFDLLLRPALREPRLRSTAVEHAKRLVIEALEDDGQDPEMIKNFRRRLVDLFLLDAFNESSSKDILEWAQLDESERTTNIWWKSNLEEILIRYGLVQPEELMDVMRDCFVIPSSRLQIVTLLDTFAAEPSFLDVSSAVLTHPFTESIYRSLEVDNSSTVCAVELALLAKLLPAAAIKAYEPLKEVLPRLFGVLGRVLCWKTRVGQPVHVQRIPYSELADYEDKELVAEMEKKELDDEIEDLKVTRQSKLEIREDLEWKRLEKTFDLSTMSLPVLKEFFGLLYFLFPCNTVHFLRNAIAYLEERDVESPWTVGWDKALDDPQIRTAGSALLRNHVLHPSVLRYDLTSELLAGDRWSEYDVSRIMGEFLMFDSRTAGLTNQGNDVLQKYIPTNLPSHRPSHSGDITTTQTPTLKNIQLEDPPPRHRKISLHDLIKTSAALKSGADIHGSEKVPTWPSVLFTPPPSTVPSAAPSRSSSVDPTMVAESPTSENSIPSQISETIAGLQREVLLLRTELNFELWLKRENVRHITRLQHDGVLTKSAEIEQQSLQHRLREYRRQLFELQKKSRKQQEQASSMIKEEVEWNEKLTSKLNDLREQRKAWLKEAKILRSENADLQAQLLAQSKLLDDARNSVFELETQIKADAPNINRLRDYEKRDKQFTTMLRMWNKDIADYNEQAKEMTNLISEHQKMKMRAEGYEKAQVDAETTLQQNRLDIQKLETRLLVAERRAEPQQQNISRMLTVQAGERDALEKSNRALEEENAQLKKEMEDLRCAMMEVLEAKSSGRIGLVSQATSVPA